MHLLATRSAGKRRELHALFAGAGVLVTDLDELAVPELPEEAALESADTFEDNALAKARYFHGLTGLPTFADDSGLVVPVLHGRPGVRSKRWSGRTDLSGEALDAANNAMLLDALRCTGAEPPVQAAFVCAAAFVGDRRALVRRGDAAGRIVVPPRGAGGFGYDAYFESDVLGQTFAEASAEAKRLVGHRGRAFAALLASVAALGESD